MERDNIFKEHSGDDISAVESAASPVGVYHVGDYYDVDGKKGVVFDVRDGFELYWSSTDAGCQYHDADFNFYKWFCALRLSLYSGNTLNDNKNNSRNFVRAVSLF